MRQIGWMRTRFWTFVLLPALALAVAALADDDVYSVSEGEHTFETFCMNCHGTDGKGDGYMADQLKIRPADLTRLTEHNGGVFPEARVHDVIDGRALVKLHGQREMPVWGDVFLWPERESPERRAYVERRIGELVEYLKSLQASEHEGDDRDEDKD